jgi:hypothetical protein
VFVSSAVAVDLRCLLIRKRPRRMARKTIGIVTPIAIFALVERPVRGVYVISEVVVELVLEEWETCWKMFVACRSSLCWTQVENRNP